MAQLTIKIKGITPLLTHNPAAMEIKANSKGSNIPTPEVEAERGLYRLDDGRLGIPGIGPRNSILSAARSWKHKRTTMASILAHIMHADEFVPLMDHNGKPLKSYIIDRRRCIVQRQGILRSRPRFNLWAASFVLIYDEQLVQDPKTIVDIASDAGNRIGIGDYRPERRGWFGRFVVVP